MRETAIRAAKEAGKILMHNFGHVHNVEHKAKKDLVTNVDKESEKKIISIIKEKFPDHALLTEESGEIEGNHEYVWIIDPLDGTHNYVYGIEEFGVLIAVMHEKELVLGVIYLPILDKLLVTEKGKGTFVNGERVQVSKRNLEEAMIIYGSSLGTQDRVGNILKAFNCSFGIRITGCSAIASYWLATGKCDAWIPHEAKAWDMAPGFLAVKEAGGKITDWDLNETDVFHKHPVITNGKIHEELIKKLKE